MPHTCPSKRVLGASADGDDWSGVMPRNKASAAMPWRSTCRRRDTALDGRARRLRARRKHELRH